MVSGGGGERNTPMPHTPKIVFFAALIHARIVFKIKNIFFKSEVIFKDHLYLNKNSKTMKIIL